MGTVASVRFSWVAALALVLAFSGGGAPLGRATAHESVRLVLRADSGIGVVRLGESRRRVTAAVGPGIPTPPSDRLGSCSGGLCRVYDVGTSVIAVDYLVRGSAVEHRSSDATVHAIGTRSPLLTVNGHSVARGFDSIRSTLNDWHVLRCSGQPLTWLIFHTASAHGPDTVLWFTGNRFDQAWVSEAPPPSECVTLRPL